MKMDALIIMKEPLDLILFGEKIWEIRGSACSKRGKITLIESKSGTVVGVAELVGCVGPLSVTEWNKNLQKSQCSRITSMDECRYGDRAHAWVLRNARRHREALTVAGADDRVLEIHMVWLGEELSAEEQAGRTPFAPRRTKDVVEPPCP
jgi:hypothetical protein